jgi:futalosine hydrolase
LILISCAVGKELAFFQSVPHVEMLVTGVGPVEAAACVSRALAQSPYDLVISAGVAGALEDAAEIGEGVVVSEDIFEVNLENGTPLSLPEGARVIDRAGSDLLLVDRLVEMGFKSLRGITVPRVTASDNTAERLRALGVGVETMEGFAVLRSAEIAGVPAIEVRGISNLVCDRARSRWNLDAGIAGTERVLNALLSLVQTDG